MIRIFNTLLSLRASVRSYIQRLVVSRRAGAKPRKLGFNITASCPYITIL